MKKPIDVPLTTARVNIGAIVVSRPRLRRMWAETGEVIYEERESLKKEDWGEPGYDPQWEAEQRERMSSWPTLRTPTGDDTQ